MNIFLVLHFLLTFFIATPHVHAGAPNSRAFADMNRGPLNIFKGHDVMCKGGWTFPGLVWGDRPVSVCMYKPKTKNVFGGEF